MKHEILNQVNSYYSNKILQHGATPNGVDWNSIESQEIRYKVLLQVIDNFRQGGSLLDYGCGYGGLLEYCTKLALDIDYTGFDISVPMINEAQKKFQMHHGAQWTTEVPKNTFDYVVASGIFNVKLENSQRDWYAYIVDTMQLMHQLSNKGFAFNVLTSYSDPAYMKDYLYYANPMDLFDFCKKNFSRNVALLHDYNLYEFSIIVRK